MTTVTPGIYIYVYVNVTILLGFKDDVQWHGSLQ